MVTLRLPEGVALGLGTDREEPHFYGSYGSYLHSGAVFYQYTQEGQTTTRA